MSWEVLMTDAMNPSDEDESLHCIILFHAISLVLQFALLDVGGDKSGPVPEQGQGQGQKLPRAGRIC